MSFCPKARPLWTVAGVRTRLRLRRDRRRTVPKSRGCVHLEQPLLPGSGGLQLKWSRSRWLAEVFGSRAKTRPRPARQIARPRSHQRTCRHEFRRAIQVGGRPAVALAIWADYSRELEDRERRRRSVLATSSKRPQLGVHARPQSRRAELPIGRSYV